MQNPPLIQFCPGKRRVPFHFVPVRIANSDRVFWAKLLTSISANNVARRDALVIPISEDTLRFLPADIKARWEGFSRASTQLQAEWGFHAVPTLKRILRMHRENGLLPEHHITAVAHYHGAVPGLVVGEVDEFQVVLLNERLSSGFSAIPTTESETLELLYSLDQYLPHLLDNYYGNIGYYFRAIFFSTDERQTLNFCLRVREIVTRSIREKLHLIERCPARFPAARQLAEQLRIKYAATLKEAHAVDCLAHIIVNYIYKFFCIRHRAADYHKRLRDIPVVAGLDQDISVALIKRCAANILHPEADDRFLHEFHGSSCLVEGWLHMLCEASAFVAELVRASRHEYFDAPRIFLTHHFGVTDGEAFADRLQDMMQSHGVAAKLIRGRHIKRDIRMFIFSRIWISDLHLLYVPDSWRKTDGSLKRLRAEGNWVNLELFYGNLLKKELHVVSATPPNELVFEDLRRNLRDYTTAMEIDQLDPAEWKHFLPLAKRQIDHTLSDQKLILADFADPDTTFWPYFKERVLDVAGRKLISVLFHGWAHYFSPRTWSVAQAALTLATNADHPVEKSALLAFIWERRQSHPEFRWATAYKSPDHLAKEINRILPKLMEFEFSLYEGSMAPLKQPVKGTLVPMLNSLYQLFVEKFDLKSNPAELAEIRRQLLTPRVA